MFRVLSIYDDFVAVLDDALGSCWEFTVDELILLNKFINVVGVEQDGIHVSVCMLARMQGRLSIAEYITFKFVDGLSKVGVRELEDRGYIFYRDNFDKSRFYNPEIAMRFGISALVTDRLNLLYCKSKRGSRVVLCDFCRGVEGFSLRTSECEYVFDERISHVGRDFAYICTDICCDFTKARQSVRDSVRYAVGLGLKIKL